MTQAIPPTAAAVNPAPAVSTCSCIVDPISTVCGKTYEYITYPFSLLWSGTQKIMECVSWIFGKLAEFVRTWLCCLPPTVPTTPSATAPTVGTPTAAMTPIDEGKAMLRPLLQSFNALLGNNDLRRILGNEDIAKSFFAHLLVNHLVLDFDAAENSDRAVPAMLSRRLGLLGFTYQSRIITLRNEFNPLSYEDKEAVVDYFVHHHLTPQVPEPAIRRQTRVVEQFYDHAHTFADRLANQNPIFGAAVNALRDEYLRANP